MMTEKIDDDQDLFGKYVRIQAAIGRGSTGVVYQCLDVETGRMVALKLGNLIKEAQILQYLQRRSIPERLLLRYFLISNQVIVCEFAPMASLETCMTKNLHFPWIAEIGQCLLRALHHIHIADIIHRDVKPSNVLVFSDGSIRLSDFSLAVHASKCNECIGDFKFMSPERLRGQEYGTSADIWSLGMLLLQLVLKGTLFTTLFSTQEDDNVNEEKNFWSALEIFEDDEQGCFSAILNIISPHKHLFPLLQKSDFCHFIYTCLQLDPARRPTASDVLANSNVWPQTDKAQWAPKQRQAILAPHTPSRLKTLHLLLDTFEQFAPFVLTSTHLNNLANDCQLPVAAVRAAITDRRPKLELLAKNPYSKEICFPYICQCT